MTRRGGVGRLLWLRPPTLMTRFLPEGAEVLLCKYDLEAVRKPTHGFSRCNAPLWQAVFVDQPKEGFSIFGQEH